MSKQPVCMIVGYGPGMGFALGQRFAREGYQLVLLARNLERLESNCATLADANITATAFRADASDLPSLRAALDAAIEQLGSPDVLIYNPSRFLPGPPTSIETEAYLADFALCTGGAIEAVRRVLPAMTQAGRGTILLTGSGIAIEPSAAAPTLSIGKSSMRTFALILHEELSTTPINVGTVTICGDIAPGTAFDPESLAEHYWRLHTREIGGPEIQVRADAAQ